MALIKCLECGAEISDKAAECPKCGCPTDLTKKHISDENSIKLKKKRLTIFSVLIVVAIIVLSTGYYVKTSAAPDYKAVKIIKKDLKKNITVNEIYYNEEIQGCLVKFDVEGESDIAAVHLNDKTVGYSSVLDEYMEEADNTDDDEEEKEAYQKFLAYSELYDFMWFYNVYIKDPEDSGWEKIK